MAVEAFSINGSFVIARGGKTEARVVTVTLRDGAAVGCGECVPYFERYGESVDSVVAAMKSIRKDLDAGADSPDLQKLLPPARRETPWTALFGTSSPRNRSSVPAYQAAGFETLAQLTTAYTLSVATPEEMFAAAKRAAHRPLLKIKLAGEGDAERLSAVRAGATEATLIVDANEAWREENLLENIKACAGGGRCAD